MHVDWYSQPTSKKALIRVLLTYKRSRIAVGGTWSLVHLAPGMSPSRNFCLAPWKPPGKNLKIMDLEIWFKESEKKWRGNASFPSIDHLKSKIFCGPQAGPGPRALKTLHSMSGSHCDYHSAKLWGRGDNAYVKDLAPLKRQPLQDDCFWSKRNKHCVFTLWF